jgi:hypothetical protein
MLFCFFSGIISPLWQIDQIGEKDESSGFGQEDMSKLQGH